MASDVAPHGVQAMKTSRWWSMTLVAGVTLSGFLAESEPARATQAESPGSAYADLAPPLLELFARGKDRFLHQFAPEEGLGPLYNETSCQTCHGGVGGVPGGPDPLGLGSTHNVNHVGFDNHGFFDPMPDVGGSLLSRRSIAADGFPRCKMLGLQGAPGTATIRSTRNTPAVFGLGLVDAMPDAEILARQNLGIDGIRGVANWGIEIQALESVPNPLSPVVRPFGPPRVGRFGWKAQTATLEQFSAEPLNTELGLSGPYFPQEHTDRGPRYVGQLPNACNVSVPRGCEPVLVSTLTRPSVACLAESPDDEGSEIALAIYHFQALLAPPPRLPATQDVEAGERAFFKVGCQNCHVPDAHTGPRYEMLVSDGSTVRVPPLEDVTFHPYTDFLLHDMGTALADDEGKTVGRVQGRARGNMWRTTPLWGARFKVTYLHDGRTKDLAAAISAHGGEGTVARDRFEALSPAERAEIVDFLLSL
jgi:CxxC motif-containing protein (DUF1111 family)